MSPQLLYTTELGMYIDPQNHMGPKFQMLPFFHILQQLKQNEQSLNRKIMEYR